MEELRVGFAFCGSFCTYDMAMAALEEVKRLYSDVTPIISEKSAATDTRFGAAHDFMKEMQRICDKRPIDSIKAAEPIGPKKLLDVMVICPCTGNTLAKLATGVTDASVTMAVRLGQEHRGPAGQEKRLLRALPAGRPGEKAHLPGGGLHQDPRDHRGGAKG